MFPTTFVPYVRLLLVTSASLNPPFAISSLMAISKRCAGRGFERDEDKFDAVVLPKRRRNITDFFRGGERSSSKGKSGASSPVSSLALREMEESEIQSLETGSFAVQKLLLDQQGSYLSYYPSFLDAVSGFPPERFSALQKLLLIPPGGKMAVLPWSQGRVKVYGKEHSEKRFTCFFADDADKTYSYSGRKDLAVHSWSDSKVCPLLLRELREHVSALCGCDFDTALLNYYRDGEDCIGWHADDEAIYGGKTDAKAIVSVSFGAERHFQIRPKPSKKNPPEPISSSRDKLSIALKGEGAVLVMGGAMQQHWQHCVPPRRRVAAPRVSVTFRRVGVVSKPLPATLAL